MTFIDFFAGVGGFRRGLELAGHKCLGFCEYDKFAVQSYRAIHDTEGEWYAKDIRTVRADDIPRADIWCAGFPCQDTSVAGKRLGFKGKRSSLFFTVTRLVQDLEEKDKPTYLFFENVKNLLSVNRGFDFARVLIELDEIGYDAEWCVFNSADVIPQNRERVFIIGRLRGGNGRQVLPIRDSDTKTDKLHGKVIKQIGNYCPSKTRDNPNRGRVYDINGIAPTLSCMGGGNREPAIAVPCLTPDRANKRQNGRKFKNNNDPMFTLTSRGRHGVMIKSATKKGYEIARSGKDSINLAFPTSQTRRGRVGKGRAQTLDTHCNQGVIIYNGQKCHIRKLTPLECWRLQAWDDESFFRAFFLDKDLAHKFNIAYQRHKNNPVRLMQWAYKHQKMSDSQLYKQAGNGVTVEVIRRIGGQFDENQNRII